MHGPCDSAFARALMASFVGAWEHGPDFGHPVARTPKETHFLNGYHV